jgi:molybdate transport system ATP-binding protein
VLEFLERVLETWRIPTLHVTHDQEEVRRLATHVLLLEAGRLVAAGTPAEVLGREDDTGPVNLLRLEAVHDDGTGNGPRGRLGPAELAVSGTPRESGGPAWIRFRPDDVILARHDPDGLSVRNHVRGTVRELVPVGTAMFVLVDIGQPLWAEITPASARELELAPDVPVVCLVKARRARIVG